MKNHEREPMERLSNAEKLFVYTSLKDIYVKSVDIMMLIESFLNKTGMCVPVEIISI